MLYLFTGLPGHGKTLHAIDFVEKLRLKSVKESEDKCDDSLRRFVYYHNIPALALPWTELYDPKGLRVLGREPRVKDSSDSAGFSVDEWFTLPPNSIVVLDECQDLFPVRPAGHQIPAFIQLLAKHRHYGIDIVLITQQPSFLDSFVRRLVDEHRHLIRSHLPKRSVVFEYVGCKESVHNGRSGYKNKYTFRWPAEVFKWYRSTVLNTHKPKMPKALLFLFVAPFLLGGLIWYTVKGVQAIGKPADSEDMPLSASGLPAGSGVAPAATPAPKTLHAFLAERKPRIDGLAWTAPRYDDLTKPVRVPLHRGCVVMGERAQCLLDGGSWEKVSVSYAQHFIAQNGNFYDFENPTSAPAGGSETKWNEGGQQPALAGGSPS